MTVSRPPNLEEHEGDLFGDLIEVNHVQLSDRIIIIKTWPLKHLFTASFPKENVK